MLSSLVRVNQGVLYQKIGLLEALTVKHGPQQGQMIFCQSCPIVKSSIGQHFRHSMDHIEHATRTALDLELRVLHYDIRERGRAEEQDMDLAKERIERILMTLEKLSTNSEHHIPIVDRYVEASFMLSNDSETECPIPSTLARELGFVAHHAIHHMAMVRIIATTSGGLSEKDIPVDFGRAPSTVNFDKTTNTTPKNITSA